MATFRRRRRDGKVQSWFRKNWNAAAGRFDFDFGWRDEPDDAPQRFLETRDPKRQGMAVLTVEEFDDGPPVVPIEDLLRATGRR